MPRATEVPWEVYQVKRGESLTWIAARMTLKGGPSDWRETLRILRWLNPWVREQELLRPGDTIVVPLMNAA